MSRRPARGASPRGRRPAPGGAQLRGRGDARRAGHDRHRAQDPARRPPLSRGGRVMTVVACRDQGRRGDRHARPARRSSTRSTTRCSTACSRPSRRSSGTRRSARRCSPAVAAPSRPAATSPRWTRWTTTTFARTIALYMRVSAAVPGVPEADRRRGPRLRPRRRLRAGAHVRCPVRRPWHAVRAPGHAARPEPDERDDLAAAADRRPRPGDVPHPPGREHRRERGRADRTRRPGDRARRIARRRPRRSPIGSRRTRGSAWP